MRDPGRGGGVHDPLQSDPSQLLLLTRPNGIELEGSIRRVFPNRREHDSSDVDTARKLATGNGAHPIGLFYRNESVDRYDEYTAQGLGTPRAQKLAALRAELSRYQI
jgi:hypothetical protein